MSDRLIPTSQYLSKSAQPTPIASPLSPRMHATSVDWTNYEIMIEDMAKGLEPQFKQDLTQIEKWFKHLNTNEKTVTLFNMTQNLNPAQVRFMLDVLKDMAQKTSVLSPMLDHDDPFKSSVSPINSHSSHLTPYSSSIRSTSPLMRSPTSLMDLMPPLIQITSPNPLRRSQTVPTRKSAAEETIVPVHHQTESSEVGVQRSTSSSKGKIPEIIDFKLLEDMPGFLKMLRLHKYTDNLKAVPWRDWIKMDDEALESAGVAALGARRKMLKVFEVIQRNMIEQDIK